MLLHKLVILISTLKHIKMTASRDKNANKKKKYSAAILRGHEGGVEELCHFHLLVFNRDHLP
jgi:hypothetical protein